VGKNPTRPWFNTLNYIKARCNDPRNKYFKLGIKCFITEEQLLYLWQRDKADLMKWPSIDRIDSTGNYHLDNCRYIEHSLNSRLGGLKQRLIKGNKIPVACFIENKLLHIFPSIKAGAKYCGGLFEGVRDCCRGKNKRYKSFEWEFYPSNERIEK